MHDLWEKTQLCGYPDKFFVLNAECRCLAGRELEIGAPGWIRTSDHELRRHVLYPTELRARANRP
jgi:hypothetical protein